MKKIVVLLFVLSLIFLDCKNKAKSPEVKTRSTAETIENEALDTLFNLMQGSFSSKRQAETDSSYYNITLHMYPIWEEHGNYLYVEQALNSLQNRPYRQRIYKITAMSDSIFRSSVYLLKNEKKWIGKWKSPKAFDSISPQDIHLKKGCDVILRRLDRYHFYGRTLDTTCISTLRGAAFARTEVTILKDKIISWDRGFDAFGNYAWGAKEGGYVFEKVKGSLGKD